MCVCVCVWCRVTHKPRVALATVAVGTRHGAGPMPELQVQWVRRCSQTLHSRPAGGQDRGRVQGRRPAVWACSRPAGHRPPPSLRGHPHVCLGWPRPTRVAARRENPKGKPLVVHTPVLVREVWRALRARHGCAGRGPQSSFPCRGTAASARARRRYLLPVHRGMCHKSGPAATVVPIVALPEGPRGYRRRMRVRICRTHAAPPSAAPGAATPGLWCGGWVHGIRVYPALTVYTV